MNPALLENIKSRQGFWSADRIDSLAPRKIEEIEFHNLDRKQSDDAAKRRDELDMHANWKWYLVTEKVVATQMPGLNAMQKIKSFLITPAVVGNPHSERQEKEAVVPLA